MGGEQVRNSSSAKGTGDSLPVPFSYTDLFEKQCPEYMAMGMTYDEFWNGDGLMVKSVRKAYEIKREKENFDMWLQARYIYDVMCCLSPIYRAFSTATEPIPFHDKPYALTEAQAEKSREDEEKKKYEQTRVAIMNMVNKVNKKIMEKGEKTGGES